MPYSYNGWPASSSLPLRSLVVAGEAFVPGVLDDPDVWTVLNYVAQQMHERVEPIVRDDWHQMDDWGYSYRASTGDSSALSCHASGTAIDYNATRHPYGVHGTFTQTQIAEVHKILAEVDVVRWGNDWNLPDGMHFEINGSKAEVAAAADRIRNYGKDWFDMATESDLRKIVREELDAKLDEELVTVKGTNSEGKAVTRTISRTQIIRETLQKLAKHT